MPEVIQIQTTTDRRESAVGIAQDLVSRRLAACVHVGGPITSVYRWQGNVETATEWTCTAKTTAELYDMVARRIRELHTYDEPEIVAVEIVQASASYLDWLRGQLAPPSGAP